MAGSKSQREITIEIAGKIASSFGNAMGAVNKQMAMMGKVASSAAKFTAAGMAAAGTAIAGVTAASVEVGKAFESQMSTVGAIAGTVANEDLAIVVNAANEMGLAFKEGSNATETSMNILEAKAKQMGATTQFSATEAGQAMEYMAMAGWKSGDMVGGIEGIMNLAAASGEDLASTSDIVTDALTAFGMTASESGDFADVLAAASSNANTNVAMLGESFKYVAPLAGTLGYSAKDTSIALGLMANAGIKGSQAGTSLKTALARMSAPTSKQAAAMQKLGLSLTNGEGEMKSLREVMGDLRSSFAGMSESEQAAAASTIFGKEAMSGMLAIINAGEADFNKLTEAIDDSSGAAEEMAKIRLDNLEGDITLLKSGLEGLGIEIYQGMNTPMREAAQAASGYVAQMNTAFQESGFSGMAEAIGDVVADALTKIAEHAPEFIDMAATLIDGFIEGIDKNSNKMGSAIGRLIVVLGSAIIKLAPRLIVTGGHLLVEISKGIMQNLPELKTAAGEAISYLMNAAKEALAGYADFLGDDSVKPFEKFIALLPAVAAGFAVFGGISKISKKISGFINTIKGAGKAAPKFTQSSNEMSAAAKNIAAIGAGLALAASGIWLLADAAVRIAAAGPVAQVGLAAMAVGVGALMLIASKLGPELTSAKQGLLAFGAAILMISAGMSLMAYAATQLGAAGPAALAGLVIMEGGMIAMMLIAESFGKKLTNAAPGLLAFGAAILMASAGMSLMAYAAMQLASAGTPAILALALMEAGILAFMIVAASMGTQLTAASVGLLAFGAGITLAAAGIYIMTQAAIQLGAAGAPAQIAMALLAVGILAFGAAAGALAPLLLAGAAAVAAFGAALAVVSTAAMLGSAALVIISTTLPTLSEYGASGALAILQLGTAMTVFAAGAALAGAGAAAAGLGFGALALAAAAADLAFAPLAIEMAAVAAAITIIATNTKIGADGINSFRESSSGVIIAMGKLAVAFVPVAAAIVPFAAAVTAGSVAVAAFTVALVALGAALVVVSTAAMLGAAALVIISTTLPTISEYGTTGVLVILQLGVALTAFAAGAALAAAAFLILSPPMAVAAAASSMLALAFTVVVASLLLMGTSSAVAATAIQIMATAFIAAGVSGSMTAVAITTLAAMLVILSTSLIGGTASLVAFSAAMTVFAVSAVTTGAGAAAAGLGFGALALAAAAADLAFAPLAVEMAAVAAAITIIATNAKIGADGINSFRESSSGVIVAMGKLALAFTPLSAAITPFSAVVTTADAATTAFLVTVTTLANGLILMGTGAIATGTGLQMSVAAMMAFKTGTAIMSSSISQGVAALSKFAAAFVIVSAPMSAFLANAQVTFSSLKTIILSSTTATVTQFIATWKIGQQQIVAIWQSYPSSFASVWNGVHSYAINAARNTAQQIKAAFEHMTITVPRPRLPHVSVLYNTQGTGDAQVKVPEFSVSYYANGAIMKEPTLFGMVGGEKGPEGIVPLNPFWNRLDHDIAAAVENNMVGCSSASQDEVALAGMQSKASSLDSRAKQLYNDITNNSTKNIANDNSIEESSPKIVYSPQITIQGNARKEDVQSALFLSQTEFNRMMKECNWQNSRTSMSM